MLGGVVRGGCRRETEKRGRYVVPFLSNTQRLYYGMLTPPRARPY